MQFAITSVKHKVEPSEQRAIGLMIIQVNSIRFDTNKPFDKPCFVATTYHPQEQLRSILTLMLQSIYYLKQDYTRKQVGLSLCFRR